MSVGNKIAYFYLGTSGFHAIILLHDILAFAMRFTVVSLPA